MKLFSKIASVAAALALVAGAGAVLASQRSADVVKAAETTDTLTAADLVATSTTYTDFSGVSKSSGAVYAGQSAKTSSGGIQLRSKNSNSGIVSTTSGGTVASVTITVESGGNTIDVYGSNSAYTAASDLYGDSKGTKVGSLNATGVVTFTDSYTHVGIRSNSGAIYLTSVAIAWSSGGGGETYSVTSNIEHGSIAVTQVTEGATLNATIVPEDWYAVPSTVSVTMGGSSVTPTYNNGLVTVENVSGDIVITGSCIPLEQPEHQGTAEDPYSVADARLAIDAGCGVTGVYASGIISSIVEAWSTKYNNISFNISTSGSAEGDQLEAFRCVSSTEHPMSESDNVEVGASVVVYGNLTKYNSTYEFSSGCKITSYSTASKVLSSITLDTTSVKKDFVVGEEFTSEGLVVTAHYEIGDDAEVTPTSVSNPDMSSAGNKTITVTYTENEVTKTATYDINVAADSVTISFDATEGSGSMDPVSIPRESDYDFSSKECTFIAPEGKKFAFWADSDGFELTVVEAIDDDFVAYASWKNLWTVSFDANGGSGSQDPLQVGDGESCDLPACTFTAPEGKAFDHWEVGGVEKTSLENVTSNVEVIATWADAPIVYEVTDTLNNANTIKETTTNYKSWETATMDSGAVYSGQSAGGNATIQLRSNNNNSGIVSTTSGGDLLSVTINFNSGTSATRRVLVFGKTSAYTDPTDLYNDSNKGTQLADINVDNGSSQTVEVEGSYQYIGIRSQNGALYLDSVDITWASDSPAPTTFTVTYDANGGTGEMVDSNSPYEAGSTVTVLGNSFTRADYTFDHWATQADDSGTHYAEGDTFTIESDVTLYAQWNSGGGGETTAARCYTLVESESQLVAGAKYIIASDDSYSVALSTTQNSNNRGQEDIAIDGNVATVTSSGVQVIELEAAGDYWAFHVSGTTTGYLYAASSSSNHLKTQADNDDNGKWTISFDEGGAATITAQGKNSHNLLQYNNSNKLFSCYLSTSTQKSVYLYRLDFEATLLHNVTCDGSSHSMPEGYTWNEDLKAVFNDLPESERLAMATAEAAADSGLERYDFIVGKYNPTGSEESDYQNFIGRSITPRGSYFGQGGLMSDNNTMIIVVTVVAITSISSIAVLLILKRRKSII